MNKLVLIMLFLVSPVLFAEGIAATQLTKITAVQGYTEYGNGDVVVYTELLAAGCDGFWFNSSNPGSAQVLSMVLAAKHSGSQVIISGDTARKWPGSPTGHFCHLYAISEY